MKIHGENVEVLWMMDGQKIDFNKHLDLENDIKQQQVISSKEIVKSVLDIIVNDLFVKTLVKSLGKLRFILIQHLLKYPARGWE